MNQAIFNPWAAPYLNGFNQSDAECEPDDSAFVWPETNGFQTLTANQLLPVSIVLDRNVDFRMLALIWALKSIDEAATPGFLYRLKDPAGDYVGDSFTYCLNTPGTWASPFPLFPHNVYRATQVFEFDILNAANFPQGVQLVFRGEKLYRRAR